MKIKRKIYLLLPKSLRKKAKEFYYCQILRIFYGLKHKLLYGKWDFFEVIALETTTYCNLRCKFCPNSKYERGLKKNEKLMDLNLFKKIINELAEIRYRGRIALYSYGEPFNDERLAYLIKYCKRKIPNATVEINSNGFLMTIEKYREVVDAGIDKICVTQYGSIMPPNTKKVFEYLRTRPKSENKITYRKLKDTELSNRGGEIELETSVNYELPICMYPNSAFTIDYKGDVILCCNDYHGLVTFGNLKDKTLLEIISKSSFYKIMKEIRNKKYRLEICKKCVGYA
jgi:radical SAM protein with 4Fe4S-binding SPASM domain